MATLWNDIRYAVRVLRKSPGFTAVVILSLALGIGANTAIFSLVNAYLLRPMPVDNPDRLVAIYLTTPRWGNSVRGLSYPDLLDYRKQDTGLSDLMGSTGTPLTVQEGERPELIWGEIVTGNYFSALGVHPVVGRGFLPDEDRVPGQKAVCVLNYNFWQRRFQADPNIAGRTIKINGHAFTIVGVAPRGFSGTTLFNFIADVWVPAMMQPAISADPGFLDRRENRWISLRGRLKPGVSPKQAEAALNVAARQLGKEYPKTNADLTVHLIAGGMKTQPFIVANGIVTAITGIMAGVVLLVLLIACANVANLMLARSATRAREMAIRVAIGATRMRLIRQLLTESVLLALGGGVLGIILSLWFNDRLKSFYPTLDFQTADLNYDTRFDLRVILFTFLIALVTAILFGLVPALRASNVDQASAMKAGAGAPAAGRNWIGRGNLLVMFQVALSCVLLIVGGLFLRSMQFANSTDPGFYRSGVTMFSLNLDLQGYDKNRGQVFEHDLTEKLRTIAGVDSVGIAFPLPLDAYQSSTPVFPEGYVPRSEREENVAGFSDVSPRYFETIGTRIIAGRAIDERDTESSYRVAVVNETMARKYWQTPERALGRKFAPGRDQPETQVIGVAQDGKYVTFGEGATPYFFISTTQYYQGQIEVMVRSREPIDALIPAIRAAVAGLNPALPIYGIRSMPQFLSRTVGIYDMGASMIGTFAIMALLLAAVGIYGVLHFLVSRRTREIGIRMALGAPQRQVLRLVLQRSLLWVFAGVVLGVGIALAAKGITGKMLAGVNGADPITIGAVVLVFALVVLIATVVPARRASRVDPIQALRYE